MAEAARNLNVDDESTNDSVIIIEDSQNISEPLASAAGILDDSVITLDDSTENDLTFQEMDLDWRLKNALKVLRWQKPTCVQREVIGEIMKRKNVLKEAKSGSGKTTALLLGLMNRILKRKHVREHKALALILTPSSEMCFGVMDDSYQLSQFCSHQDMNIVNLLSELPVKIIRKQLEAQPDILVSTPGKLLIHLKENEELINQVMVLAIEDLDVLLATGQDKDLISVRELLPRFGIESILVSNCMNDQVTSMRDFLVKRKGTRDTRRKKPVKVS